MSRSPSPPPFRFSHGAWGSLPGQPLGDKATLRLLPGGNSLGWRLDLEPGARLASPGLPRECLFGVWAGHLQCGLLGNQIDLPAGHFALLPPNIPFTLRPSGRETCVVAGSLCHLINESILFEAK